MVVLMGGGGALCERGTPVCVCCGTAGVARLGDGVWKRESRPLQSSHLQGYLAHEKSPLTLGTP